MHRRRTTLAAAALLLLALAVPAAVDSARGMCSEPLDVSGTRQLPDLLRAIKERDELAFPSHALLGSLLQQQGCAESAVVVQWLKAGSHARTQSDIERTANGLRAAVAGSQRRIEIERQICDTVRGNPRPELHASIARAGLTCMETS